MLRRARRHFHEHVEADLEVLPLMNLFVALIPMLLISAVFLQMSALRMSLPDDSATPADSESLALTVTIRPDAWVVSGRGLEPIVVDRAPDDAGPALTAALASAVGDRSDVRELTIASEESTRYDEIVLSMDLARAAGLSNISLTRDR
jgi:biopolymer transport protein ExbD